MCAWIRFWSDHSHPEVNSNHTIPRPKWPLIIPSPDQSNLWPYHPQTEVTSDHTIPRPKWPLIIPFPDRSDLWSYYCALEPNSRPCNFGLGTHRVRWTWSDQRSLLDGTSPWVGLGIKKIMTYMPFLLLRPIDLPPPSPLWENVAAKIYLFTSPLF